jgi:hypothetical protein
MEVLMPLQATSGAASYDAFGGGAAAVPQYIEDVFSTWLYTGTGAAQTINNGIDLAGEGGLTWIKARTQPTFASNHALFDTSRGAGKYLLSDAASAEASSIDTLSSFNSNGFSLGADTSVGIVNWPTHTYASWTFREQPKFFDVVTYTGNGVSARQISHALASTPGCIIIKCTSQGGTPSGWGTPADWWVYHRGLSSPSNFELRLNRTDAEINAGGLVATSTTFTVYGNSPDSANSQNNVSGETYVAYLFAHNAGGFGLTGTDNVISCGSYVGAGTTEVNVNLGYEPQWLLIKNATGSGDWTQIDTMRGMTVNNGVNRIRPNQSFGEAVTSDALARPTATGFTVGGAAAYNWLTDSGQTFIYIAIRRGPMKVPTTGTSVYNALDLTGTGSTVVRTGAGFTPDLIINRAHANDQTWWADRLRGVKAYLGASNTNAESGSASGPTQDLISFDMNGVTFGSPNFAGFNNSGSLEINWLFKRAPGFFDVVCYTGTGSARTINHNLAAVPELMIVKRRNSTTQWAVYAAPIGATKVLYLNSDGIGETSANFWLDTAPTSSVFTVGAGSGVNGSGNTYVNYLFASCLGVSKIFSYTGNGSSQTINCGFTGGARFVMVKRTDSTGNWLVVDTARGLVSAGDPTLYLNSTAAEVTGVDWIDPDNSGFIVNQEGTMNANVSSATYIGLAIA